MIPYRAGGGTVYSPIQRNQLNAGGSSLTLQKPLPEFPSGSWLQYSASMKWSLQWFNQKDKELIHM